MTQQSKVYHLDVTAIDTSVGAIANAYGDLDIVAYVARKAEKQLKELDSSAAASVTLVEVKAIDAETIRTIVTLTADVDTVGLVLRKRISAERKAVVGQSTSETSTPDVDTQHTDGVVDGVPQGHTEF